MKNCKTVVAVLVTIAVMCYAFSTLYIRAGIITGVEYDNDIYIIEDYAGLVWTLKGVEDLSCGDGIAMLMWNRMTPWTIFDDVILDIA